MWATTSHRGWFGHWTRSARDLFSGCFSHWITYVVETGALENEIIYIYLDFRKKKQNRSKLQKIEDAASSTAFQLQFKPKITKIGSGSQEIWRVEEFDFHGISDDKITPIPPPTPFAQFRLRRNCESASRFRAKRVTTAIRTLSNEICVFGFEKYFRSVQAKPKVACFFLPGKTELHWIFLP